MEFGSLHCRQDGEYNDVSFVEISKVSAMQDDVFFVTTSFDSYTVFTEELGVRPTESMCQCGGILDGVFPSHSSLKG